MDIAIKAKKTVNKAWENYGIVLKALEVDTEIIQGNNLVIEIKTLLDIISITL